MFDFVWGTTVKHWRLVISNFVIQIVLLSISFLLILSLTMKQFEFARTQFSHLPIPEITVSLELLFLIVAFIFSLGIILRLLWVPYLHAVLAVEANKNANKKIRRKGAYLTFKFIMALFSGNLGIIGFLVLLTLFENKVFTSSSFLMFPILVYFLPKIISANSKQFVYPFCRIEILKKITMPIFWRFFAVACLEVWFIFHLLTLYLLDFVTFGSLLIQALILRFAIYNFKKILIFVVLLFTVNEFEEEI